MTLKYFRMRSLGEVLAGCPPPETDDGTTKPWGSVQEFPGFMIRRMYILLTQPKHAIGEFGAGDYRTPFLFFLFFTIIFSLLSNLESILRIAFLSIMHAPGWSLARGSDLISAGMPLILSATLERSIHECLFLGINAGILILLLRLVTGNSDWRTAFSICAYCNPVFVVPSLIIAYATMPLSLWYNPFEIQGILAAIYLLGVIIGIFLVTIIAGYGIAALVHTPPAKTLIILGAWVVVSACIIWVVQDFIILPFEQILWDRVSQTSFPTWNPAAGAPGKSL